MPELSNCDVYIEGRVLPTATDNTRPTCGISHATHLGVTSKTNAPPGGHLKSSSINIRGQEVLVHRGGVIGQIEDISDYQLFVADFCYMQIKLYIIQQLPLAYL